MRRAAPSTLDRNGSILMVCERCRSAIVWSPVRGKPRFEFRSASIEEVVAYRLAGIVPIPYRCERCVPMEAPRGRWR